MIRLRSQEGAVSNVPKAKAVEYVDVEGRLALVITQTADGAVVISTPGDKLFNAYCRSQGMKESTVSVHQPLATREV